MRDALLKWIGDAPVKVEWMPRGKYKSVESGEHAAFISIRAGVLIFESALVSPTPDDPKRINAFILAHDIGHFLAADDVDLFQPNLGLGVGPTYGDEARKLLERDNEERTLAYQWAILRELAGDSYDAKVVGAMRILTSCVGVRKDEVVRLRDLLTPETVRAEWNRKLAMIASMTPALVSI